MLTAIYRNKTRLARHRYGASSRSYEAFTAKEKGDAVRYKRTQEDEIVSTVFGVLQYLPDMERTELLVKWLLPKLELSDDYDMSEITFWPSLPGVGVDAFKVEPDIVIEFKQLSGTRDPTVVMVEAKWLSPQSGEDQLTKQWRAAKKESDNVKHVFLVRTNESQEVSAHVVVDTWRQLAGRIRQALLSNPKPEGHHLQLFHELLRFFHQLGISTFEGFDGTDFNSDSVREPLNFWHRDFAFLGFIDSSFEPLVFWNEEKIK